jgi:hypothetical protein
MAIVYAAATKTARMNAVVTAIGTSGKLKFWSAAAHAMRASAVLP